MSKKTAIIITILVILAGTSILYFMIGGKVPLSLPTFFESPFGNAPEEPEGTPEGYTDEENGGGGDEFFPEGGEGAQKTKLFKISSYPVAGAVSFIKTGSTYIRYVDRATGHVEEVKPRTLERAKIVNTTRPKVYEALWRKDGAGYIERTLNEEDESVINISMMMVPPNSSSTDNLYSVKSTLLSGDVGEIVVGEGGSLLYNIKETGAINTSGFSGEKPRVITTLPFRSWRIEPTTKDMAVIYTKPSYLALGYAYNLDLKNGTLKKILGPLFSLTILPSQNERVAFGYIDNNKFVFSIRNLKNNSETRISPVTLPEKCVWSQKLKTILFCGVPENGVDSKNPDSWYQGITNFSDKIWKINSDTGTAEILIDPKEVLGETIDVVNPILSPDEDYLFFTNKNDLNLWSLELRP